jgi:hypothetical protein
MFPLSFFYCSRLFIPCSANDGEADTETDACGGPGVGRYRFDERADLVPYCQTCPSDPVLRKSYVECLALAIKQHVCQSVLALCRLAFLALEIQTYKVR